jgi:mRNA interferase MazF
MTGGLEPGSVVGVVFDPVVGREQAGRRPAVVVASTEYLDSVPELAIVVPVTTTDRGWPQHVRLTGRYLDLPQASYAMTEQPRTISRRRIDGTAGVIDSRCLARIRTWLDDFLAPLPPS